MSRMLALRAANSLESDWMRDMRMKKLDLLFQIKTHTPSAYVMKTGVGQQLPPSRQAQ